MTGPRSATARGRGMRDTPTARGRGAGTTPSLIASLLEDLRDEHEALDARVAVLATPRWHTQTPAENWSVRDQISHLCFFDEQAALALEDPPSFEANAADVSAAAIAGADVDLGRALEPRALLERWRAGRARLLAAAAVAAPGVRVPWFALPMGLPSFVTARLMETWAHGQDVADALGLPPIESDRLAHVCHLGVAARPYAFHAHGLEDPGGALRVEVRLPSGAIWETGPPDAADRVAGSALDLALVVTRRRHRSDTGLSVVGPMAEKWLSVAQAYAGPPGPGRAPGQFSRERAVPETAQGAEGPAAPEAAGTAQAPDSDQETA